MAAHKLFEESKLFQKDCVASYGTGKMVKLPGKTPEEQHSFAFGTAYINMLEQLIKYDEKLFAFSF